MSFLCVNYSFICNLKYCFFCCFAVFNIVEELFLLVVANVVNDFRRLILRHLEFQFQESCLEHC